MTALHTSRLLVGAALLSGVLAACGGTDDSPGRDGSPSTASPTTAQSTPTGSTPSASAPASGLGRDADLRTDELPVGPEDAITIATDEVKGTGIMHAVEVDWSTRHETWKWEVKILQDGTDHEVEVDANTGDIIKHEKDRTNDREKAVDLSGPLTFDDALALATAKVDGPLKGWKLEWDDGRREYQFDIADPARPDDETEVTVDVETKRVTMD